MAGFFRDHYLSDLVGFVYSRMSPEAAADDLHGRIRAIGHREPPGRSATISLILDGENAWEYYPGNGREFLRQFYRRVEQDPEIRALTASEAMDSEPNRPQMGGIFPASWINANFDVWIGDSEDVRAWDLLRDARKAYEEAAQDASFGSGAGSARLALAYDAILAAEGSDWNWWYGPEHASANDAEFDALYRTHLTAIYSALGIQAPDALAHAIKRAPERAQRDAPTAFLDVTVDGRESTYFEWLGAGMYATDRKSGTMHGRSHAFGDLHYGFSERHFYLRVDPLPEAFSDMQEFQIRLTLWDAHETRITLKAEEGKLSTALVERAGVCILKPDSVVSAAFGRILEVSVARDLFDLHGRRELLLSVALWKGGLPVDVLPEEGMLNMALGEDNFAWGEE